MSSRGGRPDFFLVLIKKPPGVSRAEKFLFQGCLLSVLLRYWMLLFSDTDFFLIFQDSDSVFRWIFGLNFAFQGFRILVFPGVDLFGFSDLDLFRCWYKDGKKVTRNETYSTNIHFCPTKDGYARRMFFYRLKLQGIKKTARHTLGGKKFSFFRVCLLLVLS